MNHFNPPHGVMEVADTYACGKRRVVGGQFDYDLDICPTCEVWHDEHGGHYQGWMSDA